MPLGMGRGKNVGLRILPLLDFAARVICVLQTHLVSSKNAGGFIRNYTVAIYMIWITLFRE